MHDLVIADVDSHMTGIEDQVAGFCGLQVFDAFAVSALRPVIMGQIIAEMLIDRFGKSGTVSPPGQAFTAPYIRIADELDRVFGDFLSCRFGGLFGVGGLLGRLLFLFAGGLISFIRISGFGIFHHICTVYISCGSVELYFQPFTAVIFHDGQLLAVIEAADHGVSHAGAGPHVKGSLYLNGNCLTCFCRVCADRRRCQGSVQHGQTEKQDDKYSDFIDQLC